MNLFVLFLLTISSGFVFEQTIPTTGMQVDVDELGNLYFAQSRRIEKRDANGKLLFQTADLNYGEITNLDLTNPLMPFVYYREQAKVVFFDNTLSEQGAIDLFEKGFLQVEYVCGSRGDSFWLWDARMSELVRVDRQFKTISSTGNLGVLLGLTIVPSQLIERGSSVYLVDKENGVLVFDVYGNYRTRLLIKSPHPMKVVDESLIYVLDDQLHILDRGWVEEQSVNLPEKGWEAFSFWRGKLYLTGKADTRVFRFSETVKN